MAREIFLDVLKTDAVILPRIVALGDIDEDELAFAEEAEQYGGAAPLDIPPKLGELERRLTLARLVAAWAKAAGAGAAGGRRPGLDAGAGRRSGAADGRHGDTRRRLGRARRAGAGPARPILAAHASISCRSREKAGPRILSEIGKIEPAARRDLLIEAEAARLTAHHDGPVIAAGSTGSMPATAKFLQAVAAPAARRGGAAGARHRSRRRGLAADRRRQGRAGQIHHASGIEPSAIRDARAARHASASSARDVEILGAACAAWPRGAGLRGDAPSNATAQWHRRLAEPEIVDEDFAAA